jgi:hypothetical protein
MNTKFVIANPSLMIDRAIDVVCNLYIFFTYGLTNGTTGLLSIQNPKKLKLSPAFAEARSCLRKYPCL